MQNNSEVAVLTHLTRPLVTHFRVIRAVVYFGLTRLGKCLLITDLQKQVLLLETLQMRFGKWFDETAP